MAFVTPISDRDVFVTPTEAMDRFVTPVEATDQPSRGVGAPSEGFGKVSLPLPFTDDELPLDFGGSLRMLEAVPEFASRISSGEGIIDAAVGTGDFILGTGGSSMEDAAKKLKETYIGDPTQESAESIIDVMEFIQHLGGLPTNLAGKGIILGPLELARQLTKVERANAAKVANTMRKETIKYLNRYTPEPIKKVGRGIQKVGSSTASVAKEVGGQAGERLRDIANRGSEAMHGITDIVMGSRVGQGISNSFQWHIDKTTGKYLSRVQTALERVAKRHPLSQRLNKNDNDRIIDQIKNRVKLVDDDAKAIVKVLDDTIDEAIGNGVPISKSKNYFPRAYNIPLLKTMDGGEDFIQMLIRGGWDRRYAEGATKNLIESDGILDTAVRTNTRLSRNSDGSLSISHERDGLSAPGITKERTIRDISEEELAPFLKEQDVLDTMTKYIEAMSRHTAYARGFGTNNEFLNAQVAQAHKELKASGGLSDRDLGRIYGMADALRFQYKPLDTAGESTSAYVDATIKAANTIAVPFIHLATLPLTAINSLAELSIAISRVGNRPSSYAIGMSKALGHAATSVARAFNKNITPHDATRAAAEINVGLNAGFKRLMDSLMHHESSIGASISTAFFKLTLLDSWTRFVIVANNETAKAMIKGHLKDISMGIGNVRAYRRDLAELNVDIKQGVDWIKRGADEADPFFEDYVKGGGLNFVHQTMMLPNPARLPAFHANPRFRLFTQLKSFPTMFGNTVLPHWYNMVKKGEGQERAALMAAVVAGTTLGAISNEMSDRIRYGEKGNPRYKDASIEKKLWRAVDRAGFTGLGAIGQDILHSSEFGRSPLTVIGGPSVSYLEGLMKAATREGGDNKKKALTKWVAAATPLVNINKEKKRKFAEKLYEMLN